MSALYRKTIAICILTILFVPVHSALADPNVIEIDQFQHVLAEQQLQTADGTTEIISLKGTAEIHVIFEGTQEGMADDDDDNTLDEVDANMVELNLSGFSSFGPVQMRLLAARPSTGRMEETGNDRKGLLEVPPFSAGYIDSFFDIFFELDVAGQRLYGEVPMRSTARLSHKPPAPGDVYENQTQIRLLNEVGEWSGLRWGPGRFRLNPIVEVDVFENVICLLTLQVPDGSRIIIPMVGNSTEHVFFEGANEGTAYDDDGNRLDEIQTEMVELNLKGYHSALGPVNMRLNTHLPSMGQMEEQSNSNAGILDVPPFFKVGTVDSFFDVYFVLEIPQLSLTLHNNDPLPWRGVLWHKPASPRTVYEHQLNIQLFDEDGNPTALYVPAGQYRPNPLIELDYTDTSIGTVDITTPSGQSYTVELAGSSTSRVFFESDFEGSARDDDNNGQDEVPAEMVALQLSGSDSDLGPVIIRVDPCALSIGMIEEQTDIKTGRLDIAPFSEPGYYADSFFDVYFQIDLEGTVMFGERPMSLYGVLNHKPAAPGDIYEDPMENKLVDEYGRDTGYALGSVRYQPTACGDALHPYPIGDLNFDCSVNFKDVAIIGLHWLECTRPICP